MIQLVSGKKNAGELELGGKFCLGVQSQLKAHKSVTKLAMQMSTNVPIVCV